MKSLMLLFVSLSVLSALSAASGQSTWQQDFVAATQVIEWEPVVAADAAGTAHIVYLEFFKDGKGRKATSGYELFYSNTASGSLSDPVQITTLKKRLEDAAISLDASGNLHISVKDESSEQVLYLNNVGGSFSTPVAVNSSGSWGTIVSTDIDIDAAGNAHITATGFVNNYANAFYATNSLGSFVGQNLSSDFGMEALDPRIDEVAGVVHIAFTGRTEPTEGQYDYKIFYINNEGGSFGVIPELVSDSNQPNAQNPSIAVDLQGVIHVGYDYYSDSQTYIVHSSKQIGSGNGFISEVVNATAWPDLAVGPANEVGLTSLDNASDVYFTTNSNGWFVTEGITVGAATNQPPKLAIGGNGYAHIVTTDIGSGSETNPHDVVYYTNNPNFVPRGGQGGGKMHVDRIDMSKKVTGPRWNAVAEVTIQDETGSPVEGATVTGDWGGGIVSGSSSSNTDAQGVAKLSSPKTKSTGTITFTVTDVTKTGWTYDRTANFSYPLLPSGSVSGPSGQTITKEMEPGSASDFALYDNHPNPFNPETSIRFSVAAPGFVEITVFNQVGQRIRQVVAQDYSAGEYSVKWDGKDDNGVPVSSGVYLYQLQAGDFIQVKKMSLLR